MRIKLNMKHKIETVMVSCHSFLLYLIINEGLQKNKVILRVNYDSLLKKTVNFCQKKVKNNLEKAFTDKKRYGTIHL
ncbi:hypothetical protein G15_1434 [Enterococcus avium]|nr:hypothetical protein G15_1434 [Enterococcus avium]